MEPTKEVRLGAVTVRFDQQHCILRHAHDPTRELIFDDADVPDLIELLYRHSARAQGQLRVERATRQSSRATSPSLD